VSESRLYHRHPVSPYMGQKLRGVVRATYLRGTVVFQEGSFPGHPLGREFRRSSLSRSQEAGADVAGATTA
jgi:allantoinase